MKIDFYTMIHKLQRKMLCDFSSKMGILNFTETGIQDELHSGLQEIITEIKNHAYHEETFIHPILKRKMPVQERMLEQEHVELKTQLADLNEQFSYFREMPLGHVKHEQMGLECYRAFNRFVADYFLHIDEEEVMMKTIWDIWAESELIGVISGFLTYHSGPEETEKWLENQMKGLSLPDKKIIFQTAQLSSPEPVFRELCVISERILGKETWGEISTIITRESSCKNPLHS